MKKTAPPYLVGIAGGSGSGKTALAAAIAGLLGHDTVARLAHDAYYRDRADLPAIERARLDFDVPEALDQELFRTHLAGLRRGETITPPYYCFVSHRRLGHGDAVEPRDVVLVEGILLLHDAAVRAALDLAIYVDAPETVRLARRLGRDTVERGRTVDAVLAQCRTTVLPAHVRYVEPTKAHADLVLLNAGRLEPVAEVATAIIRDRMANRAPLTSIARAA